MILGNLLGIDPLHEQTGLSRNNRLQESVWMEFINNISALHRTAEAIQNAIAIGEGADFLRDDDVFLEGHLLTRQHVQRERNREVVTAKLQEVLDREGRLSCEVCGFDFLKYYGEVGRGFVECHHVVPLAEAPFVRQTRLSDLAVVCANCHIMLHRGRPPLTLDALKSTVALQNKSVCEGIR
jgi:5-methylcytosine-specific restriction protein A